MLLYEGQIVINKLNEEIRISKIAGVNENAVVEGFTIIGNQYRLLRPEEIKRKFRNVPTLPFLIPESILCGTASY